jgi:phospholipid transport system substrate-binding protein
MHTRKIAASVLFLFAALLAVGPAAGPALGPQAAQAQSTAPSSDREAEIRQILDQRDREIKSILGTQSSFTDAQRQELKTLVNGLIDFRAMGRTALGPYWNDLSYNQQVEFVDVFGEVVKEQSLSNLKPYRAPVTYEKIRVAGDSAHVETISRQASERIPVVYDLVYREGGDDEAGEWRARDIVVDEVSTVGGYERSFRRIIQRHGYDALVNSLRKKLEDS